YIVALIGLPFALAFLYAFSDARIGSVGLRFVGLENFASIFQSPLFWRALANSFIFTIVSQILVIVGATPLALARKGPFRRARVVRFLILLPGVALFPRGGIGWKWILDSLYSVINGVLVALPLAKPYDTPMWLGEPTLAMASVILVHTWRLLP